MPVVIDPSKLTYIIDTPFGQATVTADFRTAYNDLWRSWHELTKQFEYVLPRRLNQATGYRAQYMNLVRV